MSCSGQLKRGWAFFLLGPNIPKKVSKGRFDKGHVSGNVLPLSIPLSVELSMALDFKKLVKSRQFFINSSTLAGWVVASN